MRGLIGRRGGHSNQHSRLPDPPEIASGERGGAQKHSPSVANYAWLLPSPPSVSSTGDAVPGIPSAPMTVAERRCRCSRYTDGGLVSMMPTSNLQARKHVSRRHLGSTRCAGGCVSDCARPADGRTKVAKTTTAERRTMWICLLPRTNLGSMQSPPRTRAPRRDWCGAHRGSL